MEISLAFIKEIAPIVYLHPDEIYWPMDPLAFIKSSRFRRHLDCARDQGYDKESEKWRKSDSHDPRFYDIPVAVINAYAAWKNGENRRPKDANRGDDWNVFLQPRGKPEGADDFFPECRVPCFFYCKEVDTAAVAGRTRELFDIPLEHYFKIYYWFFYGYSDSVGAFNHQGDWEHITVKVNDRGVEGAFFAAHNERRYVRKKEMHFKNGAIEVFSAKGSHASFPQEGNFTVCGWPSADETKRGGKTWETSAGLFPLGEAPWKDYAGAWGEIGAFDCTTGPLGPLFKIHKD
jgi:hypothetical protein